MGISIVIPVYNIRREYIDKCISSIYSQSYCEWEVLVVDDGSKKECSDYLDTFISDKIHVFHQKNSGVSAARNNGIKLASKEWVFFLDPDDWMDENELFVLNDIAVKENADMVCANSFFYKNGVIENSSHRYKDLVPFYGKDDILEYCAEIISPGRFFMKYGNEIGGFVRTPWAKLYKKAIIDDNSVIFPEGIHPNEDTFFNFMYAINCERIILCDNYLHYYRINDDGVTSTYKNTWIDNNNNIKKIMKSILLDKGLLSIFEDEWYNFCLLLLKDIFRLQLFNRDNKASFTERKREALNLISNDNDYKCAVKRNNRLYLKRSKIFAVLVRIKAYMLLDILYGQKKL